MRPSSLLPGVLLFAAVAGAADPPSLKVLAGTPSEKGKWRFEITKVAGGDPAMAGHAMTFCMDAAKQMAEEAKKSGGAESSCAFKLVEDTPARATLETTCEGKTTRSTIQREGPKAFLFSVKQSGADGVAMEGRYSYEGPCTADSAVVGLDKGSKDCQQVRAQAAALDPVKACGSLQGTQRTSCEEQVRKSRRQLEAMCQ